MKDDTLLLRQIHPSFIQDGKVTSQAFSPTPKDDKKLSVYDGDLISPLESHAHFTSVLGFKSKGVLGVTVAECNSVGVGSRPDPTPFPEHAVIDFEDFDNKEIKSKAKKLRTIAEQRDWTYQE